MNGNLKSIEIYNDSGFLEGKNKYYYQNGMPSREIDYENGVPEGTYYSFYSSGSLKKKVFFVKNKQVGNAYFYDSSGKIRTYNFIDFLGNLLLFNDYDTLGNIIKTEGLHDIFFIDSTQLVEGQNSLEIESLILVSMPPKTSINIKYNLKSKSGEILSSENLVLESPLISVKKLLAENINQLEIAGERYDSILKSSKTFIIRRSLK